MSRAAQLQPLRSRSRPGPIPALRSRRLQPHRVLAKVMCLYQVQAAQLGLVTRDPGLGRALLFARCRGEIYFVFSFYCYIYFLIFPGDDG